MEKCDVGREAPEDPLAGPGDLGLGEDAADVEVREGLQGGLKAFQGVRAWHEIQALRLQLFGHRPGQSANGKVDLEFGFGHQDFRVKKRMTAVAMKTAATVRFSITPQAAGGGGHGGAGATAMVGIAVLICSR